MQALALWSGSLLMAAATTVLGEHSAASCAPCKGIKLVFCHLS